MRLVSTVAAVLRRLRVERGALAILFVLVTVTSFVVAASPRLFDVVADDGLRYEVAGATAAQRNLQFSAIDRIAAQDGDPFGRVTARGDELWGRLPAAVSDLVSERAYAVDLTRFALVDPPNFTTLVTLTYQGGIEDQIEYEDGRAPQRASPAARPDAPPRFEIALADETADAIGVQVGDTLAAAVDPADPLLRRTFPRPTTAVEVDVVGRFRVRDRSAPFWYGEDRLGQAAIGGTEDRPIAYATALFAPSAYQDLRALDLPALYKWRAFVDVDRLDAGRLATILPSLRRLDTTFGTRTGTPGDVVYRSGLLGIVERYAQRRATTEATLVVAAMGPMVVAAGAVGLIALIIVRRRRPALLLARDRGASAGQLLVAQVWEGLVVTVPAALVGLLVATQVVPSRANDVSPVGAFGVALAATALLVAVTWPLARRARRDLDRDEPVVERASPRRLVLEVTVIGVASTAAWLLRQRSVTAELSEGTVPGFDPFLAAAPVLVGVAVGLIAIRLYPIPVRGLAAVAAHRRDLVPVLGLRSIGRHPGAAYLPLLVLTLTVAIGVFSAVIGATIDRGQEALAWREVGADYRLDVPSGTALGAASDAGAVEGVTAAAPAFSVAVPPARGTMPSATNTLLHAIELPSYLDVIAGSPIETAPPDALVRGPVSAGIGTAETPIPAVVSTRAPNGWPARAVGDVFALDVRNEALSFLVVDIVDGFPGVPPGATFVVAPLASLDAAHAASLAPTTLYLRGPDDIAPRLAAALGASGEPSSLVSRAALLDTVHGAPLIAAVGGGFGVALAVAGAYAALAVMAIVALDVQRRARELAFLRTLGLTETQMIGLTVVEHAPPVIVSLVIGVALGLGIAWLLAPGLELAVFIDPDAPVVLEVDWAAVIGLIAVIVLVVAVAIAGSTWLARRLAPAQALRLGDV